MALSQEGDSDGAEDSCLNERTDDNSDDDRDEDVATPEKVPFVQVFGRRDPWQVC